MRIAGTARAGQLGSGLAASVALVLVANVAAAGEAKGSVTYRKNSATLKYAYLVKGPGEADGKKTIRRLILSQSDIGAKIEACTTTSCTTDDLGDGISVDLDAGPRLHYWVAVKDQLVQYSGTRDPKALTLTKDEAGHLAGKLKFEDEGNGPKVDAEFDATLVKELKAGR